MSEFEFFLCLWIVPVAYVMTYIAGKYDVLTILIKRLEAAVENLKKDEAEE